MEFWGVEVKPGQTVKCDPGAEKYLHLSQASLGEVKKDKTTLSVPLFVNVEGKKLVIGTLSPEKCAQISYDLVFEKEFELSHSWKDGSVFFTGYKTVVSEDGPEDYSDDSDDEPVAIPLDLKANGGKATAKDEKSNAAAKANAQASKAKTKADEPIKAEDDDNDEDDLEDDSDEEMPGGEDDSSDDEDDDEDDSSDDEEKVTPEKVKSAKKRPAGSDSKTPGPEKKAKLVTPVGKTGAPDGKKGGHTATPYPTKQAGKTPANDAKQKPQTPKSGGSVLCKSCSKTFNSENALQSHSKAKHAAK